VAFGLQLSTQFLKVVDFAVEDDLDRTVLIADRLIAAFQIDDRKTAVNETYTGFKQEAFGVRPAVGDGLSHRLQERTLHGSSRITPENAADSAHVTSFLERACS
jgi:hypothetical protein